MPDADSDNAVALMDAARVPTRIVRLPDAWRDVHSVWVAPSPSPSPAVLLCGPHSLGVLDLSQGALMIRPLPPQPHCQLTAACVLQAPSCAEGVAVAAGDAASVLTFSRGPLNTDWRRDTATGGAAIGRHRRVLSSTDVAPEAAQHTVATVYVGDVWEGARRSLSIDVVTPADGDAGRVVVCHRRREVAPVLWVCSVEEEVAWSVTVSGPTGAVVGEGAALRMVRVTASSRSSSSSAAAVVATTNGSHVSLHQAMTLAPTATFSLPRGSATDGAGPRRWAVGDVCALAADQQYCLTLREEGGSGGVVAVYDVRMPQSPCWLASSAPHNDGEEVPHGGAADPGESPWPLVAPFGPGNDGAVAVLQAATAAPRLTTIRSTTRGIFAHTLSFPSEVLEGRSSGAAALLPRARALASVSGVMNIVCSP